MTAHPIPIDSAGTPWGAPERAAWRASQTRKRSYADEVLAKIEVLRDRFEVIDYGRIVYGDEAYPLRALRSRDWRDDLPAALITGGVHGYETSGVHGALLFAAAHAQQFSGRINVAIAPCVSPWAYERIHRWNAEAVDPNRSFRADTTCDEAAALMRLVAPFRARVAVHVDLHETTDSDETEFRPALAARDGKAFVPGEIPDGFYVVGDIAKPSLAFQSAVIEAVAKVTHIAPADANGQIIGSDVVAPGVILYPVAGLGLCTGVTDAPLTTTTEVYPDSPRATPGQCNRAQAVAAAAALAFALASRA